VSLELRRPAARRGQDPRCAEHDGLTGLGQGPRQQPSARCYSFKRHEFSSVVTFDAEWRRTGGWLLPASVLERLAPHATSGGGIGPDGWLYLLGHDRPEMYVAGRPPMGPILIHLATIAIEAEGQAFSWAPGASRTIFTVDRRHGRVREIALPEIVAPPPEIALPFR
jgi:hypothetical protein